MISMMSAARWRTRNAAVFLDAVDLTAPAEVEGSRSGLELAVSIARPGRILSLNLRSIAPAS